MKTSPSPRGYKVCVIRLDALGDTLLSTPALALLSAAGCQLQVLTHPAGTAVLRGLAEAREMPRDSSVAELAAAIAEFGPQAVLVFSEKRRALSAAFRSQVPLRIGFDPGLSQPLKSMSLKLYLTHRVPFPNRLDFDPGLHEVERYQKLVTALFPELSGELPPLHLQLEDADCQSAKSWFADRKMERPLGLQLTPKWEHLGFRPTDILHLSQLLPAPVVGFYGPAEAEWCLHHFGDSGMLLCHNQSLPGYAAHLAQCRGLVTVDTGAAHVAAAAQIPVVDVFPRLHGAHCVRRWRPWKVPHGIVLSEPGQTPAAIEQILKEVALVC